MKKRILILILLSVSLVFSPDRILKAEQSSNELQEGRFIIIMQNGRAIKNTRIPAIVLDSYRGIIWTCQNLQDGIPLWVMVDLGKNGNKPMTKKKYIARMLEWQDADLRMPAMVLDIEEGIVWNCPNIIDGKATWIEKKLNEELFRASNE
ncbi:MAG: hypothetical protein HQL27_02460 [Candidatus Omnitrophica bacterium]|nr:hypothetical protein [Candidatus Omnitrophota bacterium]